MLMSSILLVHIQGTVNFMWVVRCFVSKIEYFAWNVLTKHWWWWQCLHCTFWAISELRQRGIWTPFGRWLQWLSGQNVCSFYKSSGRFRQKFAWCSSPTWLSRFIWNCNHTVYNYLSAANCIAAKERNENLKCQRMGKTFTNYCIQDQDISFFSRAHQQASDLDWIK